MRLLVLTQKVDENDPILGFFVNWLRAFSKEFDFLNVVCLWKGEANLPNNVSIESLGKERGRGRLSYLINFYRLILKHKDDYDAVFVHMNVVYVILGFLFWRLAGKPTILWYNHDKGGFSLSLASRFVNNVFHTSPFAASSKFENSLRMPAGIDTNIFKKEMIDKKDRSLLYLGRISPIKKLDVLLRAVLSLKGEFILDVYGSADGHHKYFEKIKKLGKDIRNINFFGSIKNKETPTIYSNHEIFVNLSPSGLFDKTVLEAMACETIPLVSSQAFRDILPPMCNFREGDSNDLAEKIEELFNLSTSEKENLAKSFREFVIKNHSLSLLSKRIREVYASILS